MRLVFFILLCFFSFAALAQENKTLRGKVLGNEGSLENVHVRNVSLNSYAVTGEDGAFVFKVKVGDTLVLTHVAHRDLIKFLSEDDLQKDVLEIKMTAISNELDEVIVDENNQINAVSLGIIPEKIEKLSVNERRLRTAGDFKPVHLLGILGGGLNVTSILNAINGRTKKLKRNIDLEQKIQARNYLETNYRDFLTENFEPTEQEFQLFFDVVLEKESLEALIESKDHEGLKFLLLEAWFDYKNE